MRVILALAILLTAAPPRVLAQTNDVDESALAAPPEASPASAGVRETGQFQLEPPPSIRRRHPWRAVALTTLAFGLNVAVYWWDANFNSPDWDLRWDWASWKKKLTLQAVRFDANHFSTNAGSHTEGGLIIYLIGRGNGLGVGESTLLAMGESVVWEFIGEFYEKPSINDMWNNPLGGLAVGEPFHQLSEFFARGADNGINPILAAIFSPFAALTDWVDHTRPHRAAQVDRMGLPTDVWHRFDLYSGAVDVRFVDQTQRLESLLGIRTEINTVRAYGRPVPRAGFFGAARVTSIDAGVAFGAQGTTGAIFSTRVALGGYHWQDLHLDGDRVSGSNVLLALTNSFEYTNRRRPGFDLEQDATFGVLGPTLDLSHREGPLEGALHLEALPELGFISSLAFDPYRLQFGTEGLKTVLAENGYYYAYGALLGAQLSLRFHFIETGVDVRWEGWGSFDRADRFQERLTRNFHQSDGRSLGKVWLSLRPLRSLMDIGLSLERFGRWSYMGDVHVSAPERRGTVTLSFGL
jgi:hypothetical protein